jgi:hypothetical protein
LQVAAGLFHFKFGFLEILKEKQPKRAWIAAF